MPKPQDIFQLAQQEAVRVTASPQAWQSFLYTAAHNYHTTYLNQLLIHAQRPDAAACASMEYWNTKANRLVMRGSRSITVLQRRQGMAVTKPIFTIGDTTLLSQTRTGGPWEVTDTTRPLLLQGKPDDWLSALAQEGVSNEADRARRMLERNVADSTLQWAQPDEQMQLLQALVTQSAVYMALLRIGLPVRDEDFPAFQSASQFDTYQISLCLGGYVQAAAEPMLNAIGREALRLNRDSIAIPHEPVHNESTPTQLDSREEAVTHDVHEEPRRLPDSEPFPAEPAEPVSEPLREAASGISGAERADALRPADAGGHAADELQSNRTSRTADGGQNSARADADHPDAGPQDEPTGLDADDQQPEKAGGGSSPSDAVRSLTEAPAEAESEQALSAFSLPEFSPTLLPQLLAAETSSRASNAEYLTFYNKNPLLIDRLRFVRESYKDIFTELLLADDTRVGFHRQDNGLLVWQGAYLTRSAETLLPWRAVANALNDLIEQHELIAAIDPKELPQVEEQLSFELPDGSPPSAENDRLEKDDFLTPEKQETVIRSALPVAEYNAPQMDDGSVITDEEINLALAAGSNFENSKFRIYQQFTTTQGDHAAFLKKEYGSGGRSWDYQSGAHGWVDHGPAGLKLILTNEEGRFERRLPWRAAAKRIAYLIEMQRFLTPQELEQYPAWAAEQRKVASVVRDEPGNVPDTRPICAEGSVVYLEDDHRFTVERIGQFDVHLRDEEAPLFGRAISREEFQRQLNANPRNGGMMLSEQQHEALVQTQTEQALSYIEDYLKDEFEITEPDFSDLTRIDLGYTTTEDEKHVIQVYADLEHCTVTKLVDDTLYAQERYGSLDDLNQAVLSNLDFDSLMEIDLDEAEEHEPQENALPTDESAAHDPTNYLAPYEPEVPTGAKAKFAANLNAIRTLKQIEQRGTPATEAEQDVLAGYLGWGGLADAFDPNKDSWHSEYEQLKDLLTPEEYAAAQESTLTAFYTPPAAIHAMYRALTRMGCVGGNVLEPNATAIPWCPGELHDGQYGHYDLNCTIYLTGYDRYADPETEAPNGADGGTGNLEALAASSNDGTLTRTVIKQDQYGNAYAGNAVTARFTKTVTLPPGAAGFKGWYENGADTYGNVEWASLLYRMDWEALYGVADGIKCRSVGSALTADELQALLAGLNIDPDTARGQVVAFAISCQGHFVYGQPSSLRGGPGNASVGMNLDCSSFVQYCYWAQGLPFAAGNTASYGRTSDLQAISSAEVQPGDLRVVYAAGGEQGHVQMALGGGAWIECCYCYGVCVNMSNAWMESRGCHYFTYAGF